MMETRDATAFDGRGVEQSLDAQKQRALRLFTIAEADDVDAALAKGELKLTLNGKKLKGSWVLVRTKGYGGSKKESWLLIKHRDRYASTEDVLEKKPKSVLSNRLLPEIAAGTRGPRTS